jgi:polysaccharide transporter, PST family
MNRGLLENLATLLSVQILNYIVPLLALPFLARVLGPEHWGQLAFAEAYAAYMSLVVEYGFGLSATREIATMRDDRLACATQLINVLCAQALIALATTGLTIGWLAFTNALVVYRPLIPLALGMAFSRSFLPLWFFQGLERMRTVATLNICSNVIAYCSMFFLIHSSRDAWIALALRSSAAILSGAAAVFLAYRLMPFVLPSLRGIWNVLRSGGSLFLFRGLISLYTTANVLMMGALAGPIAVACFGGAEKLCKASLNLITPIMQTFYPRINYLLKNQPDQAAKAARLSIFLTIGTGIAGGLCLAILARPIIHVLLGVEFEKAVPLLRLMSLLVPIIATSNVYGTQWMISLHMEKVFCIIIFSAGIVNILLAFLLVPAFGANGMAVSVVIAESIVTLGVVVVLRIKGLDPMRAEALQQK